jgi:hypothetical protein
MAGEALMQALHYAIRHKNDPLRRPFFTHGIGPSTTNIAIQENMFFSFSQNPGKDNTLVVPLSPSRPQPSETVNNNAKNNGRQWHNLV